MLSSTSLSALSPPPPATPAQAESAPGNSSSNIISSSRRGGGGGGGEGVVTAAAAVLFAKSAPAATAIVLLLVGLLAAVVIGTQAAQQPPQPQQQKQNVHFTPAKLLNGAKSNYAAPAAAAAANQALRSPARGGPAAQSPMAPISGIDPEMQGEMMTLPQCKCKDIERCSQEMSKFAEKCKVDAKCDGLLKRIGQPPKIRACLEAEQKDIETLEDCVEKKLGPLGCTNDEHPKNLTVSMLPLTAFSDDPSSMADGGNEGTGAAAAGSGSSRRRRAAIATAGGSTTPNPAMQLPAQEVGRAPAELSDFLMCVDECTSTVAMAQQDSDSTSSPPKLCSAGDGSSCAFRLKCALAPPPDSAAPAFEQCEKALGLSGQSRLKKSCECLKAAGVKIVCPK